MNQYYVVVSRNTASLTRGKLVSWYGSFGTQHDSAESARRTLRVASWFDEHDPTTVVRVDEIVTGPRSMRFKLTAV